MAGFEMCVIQGSRNPGRHTRGRQEPALFLLPSWEEEALMLIRSARQAMSTARLKHSEQADSGVV